MKKQLPAQKTLRLLVTGSRTWTQRSRMEHDLARLWKSLGTPEVVVLIHGGAEGADTMAAQILHGRGWTSEEYLPDWEKDGKSAAFKRNAHMLDQDIDHVVGFLDGMSPGSVHCLELARSRGIPTTINISGNVKSN